MLPCPFPTTITITPAGILKLSAISIVDKAVISMTNIFIQDLLDGLKMLQRNCLKRGRTPQQFVSSGYILTLEI